MKKSPSSQINERAFPIGYEAVLAVSNAGLTNEAAPMPRAIAWSQPAATETTLRLLQKRMRRQRRAA